MKKFDESYKLLRSMYNDGYFPDFPVDFDIDIDPEDAIRARDW